jgi:adenine phosphoribosyltransferase
MLHAPNDGAPRMTDLARLIRDVPDFPSPGIAFKDITPLLANADGFDACVKAMAEPWRDAGVQAICAMESRGFIFGAALAPLLGAGFVPLRKPGKLPAATVGVDYALEYGSDRLEAHADAIAPGTRVLIVDDVLATGGTLAAAHALVERLGGHVVGAGMVLELAFLEGRRRWPQALPLHAVLSY